MNFTIIVRTSFGMIRRHAVRSVLTVLGITIGIMAIIVTFSIGRGAEMRVKAQIMSLGENSLYIIPGNIIERGRVRSTLPKPPKLTWEDLYALKEQVAAIEYISPGNEVMETITYGTNSTKDRSWGGDVSILTIRGQAVARGRFFTDFDVQHRSNVIVVGSEMAKNLFKGAEPLNKVLHINNVPFTVIGILAREDNYWGTEDPNKRAYMPYTVARKYFLKPDKTKFDLDFIAIKLGHEEMPGEGLRKITRALRQTHAIKEDEEDDFTIFDQQSIAKSAETASAIIQLFGLLAASISLLVGGIGIMNIMLVSVHERTREIGIRLALGATQSTIETQFLIEAIVLCLFGGILGIIMGMLACYGVGLLTNLPSVIEIPPLVMSLLITLLLGMFFGYYPARKASRLDPVDALYNL
jgi:putative ABC transport system permease protein